MTTGPGRIDLASPAAFGPGAEAACARFLQRALAMDGVVSVEVDRTRGLATVRHRVRPKAMIRALAETLRRSEPRSSPSLPRHLPTDRFTLFRHGTLASLWEVRSSRPGLVVLHHPGLDDGSISPRWKASALAEIAGVTGVRVGSGGLAVAYDPTRIPLPQLLREAEEALDRPSPWGDPPAPPGRGGLGLATITVGVAAGGLVLPELAAISVVLLLGTSLATISEALAEVRARKVGLPLLYTIIVGLTLATGQFLASSLMAWSFRFWVARYRRVLADARRQLLDESLPRASRVRLVRGREVEVLVRPEELAEGDRIASGPGEIVAADGRVLAGEAVVDESALTGRPGGSRKRPGDRLLAGSVVLDGELVALVERVGEQTRASAIGRALVAGSSPAIGRRAPTRRAQAFADRAVGPTLAAAGLTGLAVGDLLTVATILRPDYATGPGISGPLGALGDMADCFDRGLVIRDPEVLNRVAEIDLLVIDDGPASRRFELEVDRVETRMAPSLFYRLAASVYRHRADDRAGALALACRDQGGYLVATRPIDWRGRGVTAEIDGHRVHVGDSGPVLGDSQGLRVDVDDTPIGLVRFRTGCRLAAAEALDRLRRLSPRLTTVLVSSAEEGEAAGLAIGLGVSRFEGGLDSLAKAEFIRARRAEGRRVAFVGDCRSRSDPASAADLAIDLGTDLDNSAAVHLLGGRLDTLDALWSAALAHAERGRIDRLGMLVPNLACIAGALLLGFTGLHAVLLSNLGTYGLYTRATSRLDAPRRRRGIVRGPLGSLPIPRQLP